MSIEEEIFKRSKVNFNKLQQYGFEEKNKKYFYSKNIADDEFVLNVEIDQLGDVKAKVIDSFGDEYTNFRIEDSTGSFVGKIRSEFEEVLLDIKNRCFEQAVFLFEQSNRITNLIKEKYGDEPEMEWESSPGFGVFRNQNSKKWYGLIMNIDKSKIDPKLSGEVEVINIKLEPNEILDLLKKDGFYPAYHMNKKSWITILLDDTVSDKVIMELVNKSYSYTVTNKNNEWIIPANPKYFDIEKALAERNILNWKQSTDIQVNDIVYLYVAQPYSSIMYKFKVLEVNIPYQYKNEKLKIKKVMKIELIKKYVKGKYSFEKLKEYGINAVRGPRYMPLNLSQYINQNEDI